ncbi:MAG: class D sortase [Gracilibacteraceae bacterium]|jgi:sortase A|nr:class D sortase [Gracilibacteraceae bacterium]
MRKLFIAILTLVLCAGVAAPAPAADHTFGSGPDSGLIFGKPTGTDKPLSPAFMSENIRRDKDNAALPPPYFYGSGEIPTDPSSLYHDNTPAGAGDGYNGMGGASSATPDLPGGFLPSTSVAAGAQPMFYSDGSIGMIYVARTRETIKIYEGEDLANLQKGAGHFSSTSAWNGNVGLCGHNRGSWPYFSFVKDLQIGDRITYTTLYGTRTYEVYSKEQISETDYSKLGQTTNNVLTLITCVISAPELRWALQCREIV